MPLNIRPISYASASEYVDEHHRHHSRPQGHKFSISVYDDVRLCGVAMVGRPVSRHLDDGRTLEVTRLCTDGTHNACSILYAAAWRAARALGYLKIITYTLESEEGASLRAAGWVYEGIAGGKNWNGDRYRPGEQNLCLKKRWKKEGDTWGTRPKQGQRQGSKP